MLRFHSEILSPELKAISSVLTTVKEAQAETNETVQANRKEIKGQSEEIKVLRNNSLKLEREQTKFMVRIKGKNLPQKVENEDVAGLVIKLAKDTFNIVVPLETIVSAKRNFKGTSLIVR